MKAVLLLPEGQGESFGANLIDRPFLRHVVEFMVDRGIRNILVVGPATGRAQAILGNGCQWDASILYRDATCPSDYKLAALTVGERCLIASAACLPRFTLQGNPQFDAGVLIYDADGRNWTGWAVVDPEDVVSMPPLCDQTSVLSYLRGFNSYPMLVADSEFRCCSAEDLWKSHRDAQESNLSGICHFGIEVRPGVWVGRNARIADGAGITAPVYIGENSRIGSGAQIGPFAVIAKDCLIAPSTTVRHSVVAPGTYAGNNLELDHVLANKRMLFDVRFGVSIERVDSRILDGVFDFHWSAIPRRLCGAIASSVTSWFGTQT